MIVGVAFKNENIIIMLPRPARHADLFCFMINNFGKKKAKELALTMQGKGQGFYTDKGKYLDRFQAMRHAKRCKQKLIECDCPHKWNGPLFSEDVW